MTHPGYALSPSCHGDNLVFVTSGDLWISSFNDGFCHRFGLNFASLRSPLFSPCGQFIAFVAGDDPRHVDIYSQNITGGSLKRLTFLQSNLSLVGWDAEGLRVSSSHNHPLGLTYLYTLVQGQLIPLSWGDTVTFVSNSMQGGCVVQRHGYGYTSWKRYRGGAAGELWIDPTGQGDFHKLLPNLSGNTHRPFWINQRIYFLSDHEGLGRLYSCTPQGQDIQQHTHQSHFYVRDSSTDGTKIVYSCGGKLGFFNIETQEGGLLDLKLPRYSGQRHSVNAYESLSSYALHPQGRLVALATRGRLFVMTPWKGPVWQYGPRDGVRYRLVCWLPDGHHILAVRDEGLEEVLELYHHENPQLVNRFSNHDWGRILQIKPCPVGRKLALVNHRNDLMVFDLDLNTLTCIAHSQHGPLDGFNWSCDGQWIAFSFPISHSLSQLQVYALATRETHRLTRPLGQDFEPVFNPEGTRLYFLSRRTFKAEFDAVVFDLHFQYATQAYVLALTPDQLSPFIPPSVFPDEEEKEVSSSPTPCSLDTTNIEARLVAFPLRRGDFSKILGVKGKAYLLEHPHENDLHGTLQSYDFALQKSEELSEACDDVVLSLDGKWMLTRVGHRLRVTKVGEDTTSEDEPDESYREGGWVALERIPLSIDPQAEWRHMFQEAWRLQKELFWNPTMGTVDWDQIYDIYSPCLDRVTTTQEVHAVIEEMQGELGTSHAYVWSAPRTLTSLKPAFLGARWTFEPRWGAYQFTEIHTGEEGSDQHQSPLTWPGLDLRQGDLLWAIAGIFLRSDLTPQELLLGQAGRWIPLIVSRPQGEDPGTQREVVVRPLASENPLLYTAWVQDNQRYVHQATQDRVGYIHIPDMDRSGFACFSRSYVQEHHRQGLIIDVRYNGGGFVSSLILEKLNRKRLGYDHTRWHGCMPYPLESPVGPMVALTNEYTGSDGDVFCHSFKALNLGPLIGKRTWGGVVGIWPRHPLVDGTTTSQPEYSFWCHDVGWRLENHGVDPDIEVQGPLHLTDHNPSQDPQLNRGIQEILGKLP